MRRSASRKAPEPCSRCCRASTSRGRRSHGTFLPGNRGKRRWSGARCGGRRPARRCARPGSPRRRCRRPGPLWRHWAERETATATALRGRGRGRRRRRGGGRGRGRRRRHGRGRGGRRGRGGGGFGLTQREEVDRIEREPPRDGLARAHRVEPRCGRRRAPAHACRPAHSAAAVTTRVVTAADSAAARRRAGGGRTGMRRAGAARGVTAPEAASSIRRSRGRRRSRPTRCRPLFAARPSASRSRP